MHPTQKPVELLEYLIKKADELKQNDDKRVLTSNYFLMSLLTLLSEKKKNKLPAEVKAMSCTLEIEAAEKLLEKYMKLIMGDDYVYESYAENGYDSNYNKTYNKYYVSHDEFDESV